jgi:molybdopterin-guanine dinucleotide biosynthesis protein A
MNLLLLLIKSFVEVSCIILAGGKSLRVGKDKAFLRLNNQPLINHVFNHMKTIFSEIMVVVKNEEQKRRMEKVLKNVKIVEDRNKISSPIAGIKEGVKHSKNDYVFVVACDMPFLDEKTVKRLLSEMKEGVECVVYSRENSYEPLCAVYKKEVFTECDLKDSLHSLINRIENKILILVNKEKLNFFNINTEEDLKIAGKCFK